MADYWLINLEGAQLGPVSLQVIEDLAAAGRLRNISRASKDGTTWLPVYEVPEIDALLSAPPPQKDPAKVREAAQLETEVARLRALPLHEALGVSAAADRRTRHAAFFQLVKRLAPEFQPEPSLELRQAKNTVLDFLSRMMLAIAADGQAGGAVAAPAAQPLPPRAAAPPPPPRPMPEPAKRLAVPPVVGPAKPAGPPPPPRPQTAAPAQPPAPPPRREPPPPPPPVAKREPPPPPQWERRKDQRYAVKVTVSAQNYGMFTDCETVNVSKDGMYLASQQMIPLFEMISITLVFEDLNKTIELGARVIWQNDQGEHKLPRGVGVKFTQVSPEQMRFIHWFVRKAQFEAQQQKR